MKCIEFHGTIHAVRANCVRPFKNIDLPLIAGEHSSPLLTGVGRDVPITPLVFSELHGFYGAVKTPRPTKDVNLLMMQGTTFVRKVKPSSLVCVRLRKNERGA